MCDDGDRLRTEGEMLMFDASGIRYPAVRFVDDCDALYVGALEENVFKRQASVFQCSQAIVEKSINRCLLYTSPSPRD